MTYVRTSGNITEQVTFERQADATLSQANPVSATWYTVLETTKNARIINITTNITWAVTQPTPLEIRVTIDGQAIIHAANDPVSATNYAPIRGVVQEAAAEGSQGMLNAYTSTNPWVFPLEGRSVKIEARITWATTQPTPLVVRVKYAKRTG